MATVEKSPERKVEAIQAVEEEEVVADMNEIKALPAPEIHAPEPEPVKPEVTGDLVDLTEDGLTADDQGNKFTLALFAGPANGNSLWKAFLCCNNGSEVTSVWQNPDGTILVIGQEPFAASLSSPPSAYVQMSDIEKKQHLGGMPQSKLSTCRLSQI